MGDEGRRDDKSGPSQTQQKLVYKHSPRRCKWKTKDGQKGPALSRLPVWSSRTLDNQCIYFVVASPSVGPPRRAVRPPPWVQIRRTLDLIDFCSFSSIFRGILSGFCLPFSFFILSSAFLLVEDLVLCPFFSVVLFVVR